MNEDIEDNLCKAAALIGHGREGGVYDAGDEAVRKVFRKLRGASLDERLSLMERHPELFPRILDREGDVVTIERLSDIPSDKIPARALLQRPDLHAAELEQYPELLDFQRRVNALRSEPLDVTDLTRHYDAVLDRAGEGVVAKDFRVRNNQTTHNIMQRADGSWVISDPVVWNLPTEQEKAASTYTPIGVPKPMPKAPMKSPMAHHRYLADDDEHEKYAPVGIDGLLAATEKLLAVNRGLAETDDRDSLPNDRVHTVDRLMAERVKLDHGHALRAMMGRLSRMRTLDPVGPDAFGGYTMGYLKSNPLVTALEEINPMHILEQKRRITKMGPGGIGDPNAITDDMTAVSATQFGFVDPLAGPESEKAGIDVRLAHGARVGSDGRIYQLLINRRTGKKEWVSPSNLRGKTLKLPD